MNRKHLKTLDAVFVQPIKSDISWKDVESMLIALGAELSEGRGSRVRIVLNGRKATMHRPHPQKEMDKGAVKSLRTFLEEAGVK